MGKATSSTFVKSFKWPVDITWFDRDGVLPLGEGLVAHLTLDTHGTVGHYPGFRVRVVSHTGGQLVSKFFNFNDYLTERSDRRPDYTEGFACVSHTGWDWYIAVPANVRPFTVAVMEFIKLWSKEGK